jgi:hypothetical protein
MNYCCTIACIVALVTSVEAQKSAPGVPSERPQVETSARQNAAESEISQRHSIALSLLTSLATEARTYRDETLRARVQARVADALWDEDRENARALFRRAWEAAEEVETQPVINNGASGPGRVASSRPTRARTNLRAEILKLAAKRDFMLGEEFLAKLAAAKKVELERISNSSSNTPSVSLAEISERLRLAGEFLEAGNTERALQFADPALIQVTTQTILFLVALRSKDAASADQRFAALLARAGANADSDANTVSILTTYAFTPSFVLLVTKTGIPSTTRYGSLPAPDIAPELRTGLFQVAANILLRPIAQLEQSSAGLAGTFFIATRLLPLFQQYASDLAPAISAQLAALGPDASQATLNAGDRSLNLGMRPDDPTGDGIRDELKDRLSRAQGVDARDRAYAFAAMHAAEAGDPRAPEYVDKIEDSETRSGIRSFVKHSLISELLRKKNVDEALQLARKSELTPTLRAHVLTRVAGIVAKTDHVRALELLGEALSDVRRIDASTSERAYAFVALLSEFARIDHVRAWELAGETIKAANAVSDFTGENGYTSIKLEGKFKIDMGVELASATDLPESFVVLADVDFYQAINAGKTFSSDAARALVTLAIVRSTLENKRKGNVH